MALVRRSPWQDLWATPTDLLGDPTDDTFARLGRMLADVAPEAASGLAPADILRRGEDLVFRMEVPGVDPEDDLDVQVRNGILRVRGERRHEESRDDGERRSYRAFERAFVLPDGADPDAIRANYDHGVLEVVVPGVAREDGATRIPVRAREGGLREKVRRALGRERRAG